ncbi:hypothetical protein [Ornithinibacillus sp. FSL M8-0202]|uniref:hypothetical protein n=1 Tax=Ornithinibacillus sp. FSL M8-0202 TaxID=2921616 RepID=UPI0030D14682
MWHRKAPPSIDISILARGASFLYALFDYGFTNYVVEDIEKVRNILKEKGVSLSPIRDGEPKRFDLTDINGNMISVYNYNPFYIMVCFNLIKNDAVISEY